MLYCADLGWLRSRFGAVLRKVQLKRCLQGCDFCCFLPGIGIKKRSFCKSRKSLLADRCFRCQIPGSHFSQILCRKGFWYLWYLEMTWPLVVRTQEGFPAWMYCNIEEFPIIHASSFYMSVIYYETQWFY